MANLEISLMEATMVFSNNRCSFNRIIITATLWKKCKLAKNSQLEVFQEAPQIKLIQVWQIKSEIKESNWLPQQVEVWAVQALQETSPLQLSSNISRETMWALQAQALKISEPLQMDQPALLDYRSKILWELLMILNILKLWIIISNIVMLQAAQIPIQFLLLKMLMVTRKPFHQQQQHSSVDIKELKKQLRVEWPRQWVDFPNRNITKISIALTSKIKIKVKADLMSEILKLLRIYQTWRYQDLTLLATKISIHLQNQQLVWTLNLKLWLHNHCSNL